MKKKALTRFKNSIALMLMTGMVMAACAAPETTDGSSEENAQSAESVTADSSYAKTGEGSGTEMSDAVENKVICTSARLPEEKYEGTAESFLFGDAYSDWAQAKAEAVEVSLEAQDGMDAYYLDMVSTFLKEGGETSVVCSPFNMYMALSVLAETADTETLAQILKLLQAPDKDTLAARVGTFWEANYADTPLMQELLANSLWLANDLAFREETINRIAGEYHASVFRAPMGDQETNRALRDWVNTETKDLLKEYADNLELQPETVAAIISTLYNKAAWRDSFAKEGTTKQTFHGVKGDTEADMMHRSDRMQYYDQDGFTAVALPLTESGYMIFCLPDEGVELASVISNPDSMKLFRDPLGEEGTDVQVNLTLPKFKVSGQIDMKDGLKALGITDAFEGDKADFSSLTEEADLILSEAIHACMVETDEDGVTGAAYTALMLSKTSLLEPEEEVDFVLDRPFYFAVTSEDNQILFAGTVCNS